MPKAKKRIFISHSSDDKHIIDILVSILENYLGNGTTITNYDVTYSTSDNLNYKFGLSSNIGINSINLAGKSDIFLAYMSENYKKSQICMAELGCGFYNNLNKKGFIFIPIKDDYVSYNDMTYILNGNTVLSKNFDVIIKHLDNVFNSKLTQNQLTSLRDKFNTIYNGFDHDLSLKKNDIQDYVIKTFNKSHPLKSFPFVQYVDRDLYNNFNIDLLKLGEEELIWTAYKSPFNVKKSYIGTNKLTKWDEEFEKANSKRKKRLIIFDSLVEMREFFDDKKLTPFQRRRKTAFLKANENCLYYTSKNKLLDEYNKKNKSSLIRSNKYNIKNELFFEFAYIKSIKNNFEILIFSDYDNNNISGNKETRPLLFIDPNDGESKYLSKIEDSLKINKMIIHKFNELLSHNIIIKI